MPWEEERNKVEERMKFVLQVMEGETIAGACEGVWDFAEDGAQDMEAVSGGRAARVVGPDAESAAAWAQEAHPTIEQVLLKLKREKSGRTLGQIDWA